MQVTHIGPDRREEWNTFVSLEPSFALLQSWEWGEFKEKLGWKAIRVAVERQGRIAAGAQMLVKPVLLGAISIAYIPRGPVGDWLNEAITFRLLPELHRVARDHRAFLLKIEPSLRNDPRVCEILRQNRFQASHYTNQPRATITVDLTPDLDDILRLMRKKTRQYIRYAARKGVTIRVGSQDDLSAFYDVMRITGRRRQFSHRVRDYYEYQWQTFADRDQAVLLMAFHQDQLLAVRMIFCFGNHAAEFHAGSSGEYRHLRPDYLLIWEAIKWAKAQGCCTYDLWGIPDEVGQAKYEGKDPPVSHRLDGLWGVYHFKRGFSKNVVFYTGAHDYVYSPGLYGLVANKFFDEHKLDRIAVWLDSLRLNWV